jgi:hypothetical protein
MNLRHLNLFFLFISVLLFAACGDSGSASSDSGDSTPVDEGLEAPSGSGKTLTTEIPPELIEGTPQPVEVPNLEAAPKRAPALTVPEATELLSVGKPVTASDDFPIIGELDYVTDGDKQAGEGYFVELMDGLQWVQIDLEQSAQIEAVWVWHYHSQKRAYHDVIVQVSDDPAFESGVTSLFNNDYDNSADLGKGRDQPYVESRFGKLIDADGVNGRYVRLYSNGNTANDMNHYIEVEVYGISLAK